MWNRREVLAAALGSAAALAHTRMGWAAEQSEAERALVLLFLDGGNDGLNTLVPFQNDAYHRARPALALSPARVHRIDDHSALHPSLGRLAARARDGQLAFLRGVSYPEPNLSHFRARDIWHSASTASPAPATGWLGRYADRALAEDAPPTALVGLGQVSTPHPLRAERHVAYALSSREGFQVRRGPADRADARWRALERVNGRAGDRRIAPVGASVLAAERSIQDIERALALGPKATYPQSRLAGDLEVVARILEANLGTRCLQVTHGGYDTHASQAPTHELLLSVLDGALDAFLTDLEKSGTLERTLVLVVTEFGRRVAENGVGATAGTDHGTSSLVWAAGGGIRPGLHGPLDDLDRLDENGNQVPTADFRSVYAEVLERWLKTPSEPILGAQYPKVGLLA